VSQTTESVTAQVRGDPGTASPDVVIASTRGVAERAQGVLIVLGYVMLGLVVMIVAAMSWAGLVGFAHRTLHMHNPQAYTVPGSLDLAGMTCAFLALRSVARGDSAAMPRFLVIVFVVASSTFNFDHARQVYRSLAAEAFYAGMSIAVWAMWETVLRQIRRDLLRVQGAVERPLPRFRALRWLRFPRWTWSAWSLAVRDGLETTQDAIHAAFESRRPALDMSDLDVRYLPKGQALHIAFGALGALDVPAALAWLSTRGVEMDRSQAYAVRRQITNVQALALAAEHVELPSPRDGEQS
jgi:hypothetical protein